MAVDSLATLALAVGTVAGLFLTLALAAAGVVYEASRDAFREAQRDAWTLARESALMVSGLEPELLTLLSPTAGLDPLDTINDLATAWTAVGSAGDSISETVRRSASDAAQSYQRMNRALLAARRPDLEAAGDPTDPEAQAAALERVARQRRLDVRLLPVHVGVDLATRSLERQRTESVRWDRVRADLRRGWFSAVLSAASFGVAVATLTSFGYSTSAEFNFAVGFVLWLAVSFMFGQSYVLLRRLVS